MPLKTKINWLVSLNICFVLVMAISCVSYMIVEITFRETGERALAVSRTVAGLPQIVRAFGEPNPSLAIQPIVEDIRKKNGAEFIVVSDMKLIRYSHPNPAEIGRHMKGKDNDAVLEGRESITRATGTLGYAVRGKAPVFGPDHRQIGVVSTGILVRSVWGDLSGVLLKVMGVAAIALLFGLIGSYLLSGHVKRQIFNMEPHEIAFATREQAAVFEAIREGIIAVNSDGTIVGCNHEAKKMLGLEESDLMGKNVAAVVPATRLPEVLRDGLPQYDQPMVIGNTLVVANRVPVILAGQVIGAVSTFRDKMELDQLEHRLADIGYYVDTLRSQRHEFMNKLHLISGLIQMSDYDAAKAVIGQVNEEYQRAVEFYLARIRDSAIVGILVGKTHRAGELGIHLTVDPESLVSERCPHREVVVTILGNTMENAFEAFQASAAGGEQPAVGVFIREAGNRLLIRVRDNGPGVDPGVREHLLEDGITTKGQGRGLGLALLSRLIANAGGSITFDSSASGTMVSIDLPTARRAG